MSPDSLALAIDRVGAVIGRATPFIVLFNLGVFSLLVSRLVQGRRRLRSVALRRLFAITAGLCAVVVLGSAQRLGMTPGVLPAPLVGRFAMEGQVVLSISAAIALGGLALSAHSLARRLNQADRYYGLAVASPLPTRSASLSPREAQIVAAVAAGYISDRELAEHLHIAPSTAATHVRNIMRKAGLSDRRLLSTLVAG